jgi:hypothetical protein
MGFLMKPEGLKIGLVVSVLSILWMMSGCSSSPLWEKDKDTLVRTLTDNALRPGRYMIYWDGKDKDKKTVSPGKYDCILRAEDYEQRIEMTAMDGTKGEPADSTGTGVGWWYLENSPMQYILEPNIPEPFYAKDGTNISFEIPATTRIQVSVHRQK